MDQMPKMPMGNCILSQYWKTRKAKAAVAADRPKTIDHF
jgi:hypothetical protein